MLQRDRETREALDEIHVQALEVETQKAAMEQVRMFVRKSVHSHTPVVPCALLAHGLVSHIEGIICCTRISNNLDMYVHMYSMYQT